MRWIVQENLHNEDAFTGLITALTASDTKHDIVKLIPFSHTVEPAVHTQEIDGEPTFCVGSTSMKLVSQRHGWEPGYIDHNLDIETLLHEYGTEMLNNDACVGNLDTIEPIWNRFHIRPALDDKAFAGMVMTRTEFYEWRTKIIAMNGESSFSTLRSDDRVVISSCKDIIAEWRCIIVDRKFVTGSRYKRNAVLSTLPLAASSPVAEYAERMASVWIPNRAFAMDIAMLDTVEANDLRIIEINSINASGFYASDMHKFVAAINAMEF